MRIFGWILLIAGVLLEILFVLAQFGGGHLGYTPFILAFFVLSMGLSLVSSGRGLVKPGVAASTAGETAASGDASGRAAQPATVEMPMTPEVAAAIMRQTARTRRMLRYVVVGGLILFCGIGLAVFFGDSDRTEGRTFLAIFAGVGLGTAILIGGISWFTTQWPVQRDLRSPTYLRTTGPVELVSIAGGYMLRLADRAFLMNGRSGSKELVGLGWGTVDHTTHGHVLLGAWNREGNTVYSLPGYNATPK